MAQSTISQRIALEGAEDILKQLADLGQAGEKAIQQIQSAMAPEGLASLSGFAETARAAFGRLGLAVAPIKTAFGELETAVHEVGTRLTEVASIFGVGLVAGIAGGVAGIFELIKASAESAHQLEVQSEVLGISTTELQTFRRAATEAGVDSDKLTTSLTRFAQNVGKENEKLFDDGVKLLQSLSAASSQVGVAVVQGIKPAGDAVKTHIISNITDSLPQINAALDLLRTSLSEHGIQLPDTFFASARQELLNFANDATKQAQTVRLALAQFGVNLPAQTIFEQLAAGAQKAKDPLLALGITLGDLQRLSVTDTVLKTVDALQKVESPTQRAQLSLQLFGRTWPEVLKALRDGSAGFDSLREALIKGGLALDDDGINKLSAAERALIALQGAGVGLRNQLALVFAPVITTAAEAFTNFIKSNVDTFKAWAQVIVDQVLPGLKNLAAQFGIVGTNATKAATDAQKLPDVVTGKTGVGVVQTASTAPKLVGPQPGETPISVSARETPIAVNATAVRLSADQLAAQALAIRAEKPLAPVLPVAQTPSEASTRPLVDATTAAGNTLINTLADINKQLEGLQKKWTGLSTAAENAFSIINKALEPVTFAFMRLFGTENLNNAGTALILLATKAVGGFALIRGAIGLVSSTLMGLSILLGLGATGPFGLIAAGLITLGAAFVIFQPEIEAAQKAFSDFAQTVGKDVKQGLSDLTDALEPAQKKFSDFAQSVGQSIIAFLTPAAEFISSLAKKLLNLGGGLNAAGTAPAAGGDLSGSDGQGLGLDSAATTSTFASGGRVPGGPSGTDTVPAYLTPGEFVNRREAVQHYGVGLFHAINTLRLPVDRLLQGWQGYSLGGMVGGLDAFAPSPSPLMLAAGGAVFAPAGGGGGPMHSLTLNLSGQNFALDVAPGQVFDKLARHARSSAITSAGRKPSWFAS